MLYLFVSLTICAVLLVLYNVRTFQTAILTVCLGFVKTSSEQSLPCGYHPYSSYKAWLPQPSAHRQKVDVFLKVESGMGCPDWHTAMHSLRLQRLLWIYCPGHAGVSGNERTDRLASTADITSGLQLGRAEVLRGLRNFLSTDKPEHHSIDRLKERGVEKGSGRHSTLQGRERPVFNQTNIGTVSRATLGRLLRDGAERVRAFPSATMPS